MFYKYVIIVLILFNCVADVNGVVQRYCLQHEAMQLDMISQLVKSSM